MKPWEVWVVRGVGAALAILAYWEGAQLVDGAAKMGLYSIGGLVVGWLGLEKLKAEQ